MRCICKIDNCTCRIVNKIIHLYQSNDSRSNHRIVTVFMWTFTRSVKIHILRSCSFPDWDVNFRDNSCQRFRKLSRVFGKSEVLEGVYVKLDVNPGNELPTRRHKESITHARYSTFINLYICMAFD